MHCGRPRSACACARTGTLYLTYTRACGRSARCDRPTERELREKAEGRAGRGGGRFKDSKCTTTLPFLAPPLPGALTGKPWRSATRRTSSSPSSCATLRGASGHVPAKGLRKDLEAPRWPVRGRLCHPRGGCLDVACRQRPHRAR